MLLPRLDSRWLSSTRRPGGRTVGALLTLAVLLAPPAPPVSGEGEARTALGGVRASVVAPAGWERLAEAPAAGQWRVVFRGPKLERGGAQCEARVFPVQETQDAPPVLMQAADEVARQVGGEGFGLPGLRAWTLLGRAAAEAMLIVSVGPQRMEGRIRLLRADTGLWAMAWGLAPADAPPAVREATQRFVASLEPDEPAFFDPLAQAADPEEALVVPRGEEVLRRRQLLATVDVLESATGFRFPRAARAEALGALREDAQRGDAAARQGYRDVARALHEAQARPAEEQHALRLALGRPLLEALQARSKETYLPATRIVLLLSLGPKPGVGQPPDGLTRFELEHLLDAAAFVAALGADRAVADGPRERAPLRDVVSTGWEALDAPKRAAWKAVAARAPDLEAAWAGADEAARRRVRAHAALLLRTGPLAAAGRAQQAEALAAEPKGLRRWLDAAPLPDEGLLGRVLAAPPEALARLTDLLPQAPARLTDLLPLPGAGK